MTPEADAHPPDEPGTDAARGAEEEHPEGPPPWRKVAEDADAGDDDPPAA